MRAERLDPTLPSQGTELLYLQRLDGIVKRLDTHGSAIAKELHATWIGRDSVSATDAPRKSPTARARAAWEKFDPTPTATIVVDANAIAVDKAITASVSKGFGVDIKRFLEDKSDLSAAMARARAANIGLIKSIPSQYFDLIDAAVEKHWTEGARWETLADRISDITGVTDSRATLIAQDQTSKMTAAFDAVRQPSLGIEGYEWSDSHDKRVRHSHHEMDGRYVLYAAPPLVDGEHVHAGEAVRCRCGRLPIVRYAGASAAVAAQYAEAA